MSAFGGKADIDQAAYQSRFLSARPRQGRGLNGGAGRGAMWLTLSEDIEFKPPTIKKSGKEKTTLGRRLLTWICKPSSVGRTSSSPSLQPGTSSQLLR